MLQRENTHCMTGEKLRQIFKKLAVAYFESAILATTWRNCGKSPENLSEKPLCVLRFETGTPEDKSEMLGTVSKSDLVHGSR
jgi:hypothetical protein